MPDYYANGDVHVPGPVLYAYLADVANLPKYFPRLSDVEPISDDRLAMTAALADGPVRAKAWFRPDPEKQTVQWGADGSNHYHGHMTVVGVDRSSAVAIRLTTDHADAFHIQQELEKALRSIKRLVEAEHAAASS